MTFSGNEMGSQVLSGASLSLKGPTNDPVRAAYNWYAGYNSSRFSWDPLTMLYACVGLGDLFDYAVNFGYNHVFPNGSNAWVYDQGQTNQRWLELKSDKETAGRTLDMLFLKGAESVQQSHIKSRFDELYDWMRCIGSLFVKSNTASQAN